MSDLFAVFRSRRLAVLFALGFASGLPLLLTGHALRSWLTDAHVDRARIAGLSLVGLAYTFKFAWAPLLDRYELPWLGRRRGWVLAFQLALVVAIAAMGAVDPIASPRLLVVLAVFVAFLSASQDVVLDAYNADLLEAHERAIGSAIYVAGYRGAVLVVGTLGFIMADHVPWRVVYATMAALMLAGVVATLFADEPRRPARPSPAGTTLASAFVMPFVEMFRRFGARTTALVLAFAALYRFGYYFTQPLIITFLQDELGFAKTEIGTINKLLGFAGAAIGAVAAGGLVARFGLRRMLVAFGALAALTNLMYVWLAAAGHSVPVFCAAVLCDNIANALGTSAFLAVLMAVCSPAVSATQFALLTSLASVGERVFGWLASDVVDAVGWSGFFVVTIAAAVPGLVLAWRVGRVHHTVTK